MKEKARFLVKAAACKGYNRLDHNLLDLLSLSPVRHSVLNITVFASKKKRISYYCTALRFARRRNLHVGLFSNGAFPGSSSLSFNGGRHPYCCIAATLWINPLRHHAQIILINLESHIFPLLSAPISKILLTDTSVKPIVRIIFAHVSSLSLPCTSCMI